MDRDELRELLARGENCKELWAQVSDHMKSPRRAWAKEACDAMDAAELAVVPKEATEEMFNTAWDTDRENIGEDGNTLMPEPVWQAMIAEGNLLKGE